MSFSDTYAALCAAGLVTAHQNTNPAAGYQFAIGSFATVQANATGVSAPLANFNSNLWKYWYPLDASQNQADTILNQNLFPPQWQASTVFPAQYTVVPNANNTNGNGLIYRTIAGGTSSATQPTWPTTVGSTVTDGTVTWICTPGPWFINDFGNLSFRSLDFPAVWTASTAYASSTLVNASNGILYAATTGGTSGSTAPTWPTTLGATVTDGTVVWTALNYIPVTGPAYYQIPYPSINWDMSLGQSLIFSMTFVAPWDSSYYPFGWVASTAYAVGAKCQPSVHNGWQYVCTVAGTSGSSAPTWPTTVGNTVTDGTVTWKAVQIVPNRPVNTTVIGNDKFKLVATGSTFNTLRLLISDGTNTVLSGFQSAFDMTPLDGNQHNITIMIDGVLKMVYWFMDGVAIRNADMYEYGDYISGGYAYPAPNEWDISAVTGSTASTQDFCFGGSNGSTSWEMDFISAHLITFSGALPVNLLPVATWFNTKAGLLPQYLCNPGA